MLSPPGSSSGAARRPAAPNRRKAEISPDDVIRQLQRVQANKKCADCSSKLPTCVNLTIGTFICMTCAGVHRESNARVKSVGHSSFTAEEAEQLKATDNDQINALYMTRYSPSTERLRRPMDNRDPGLVRAWILRKYQDRAWYGGGGNEQQQRPPAQQRQQRPPAEPQPTMVQIPASNHPPPPQRKTPSRQAAVDLFADFDSGARQPQQPPQQQQQWDAFGNSAISKPEQAPFEANFATFSPPAAAQSEAFPADFGSSQARQSQPDPFQQAAPAPQTQTQMADPFAQQNQPVQQQYGQFGQTQPLQANGQQYVQPQFQPFPGQQSGQNQQQPQQAAQGGQQFGQFGQPSQLQQFDPPQQQGPNGMMMNQSFAQPGFGSAPQQVKQPQSYGANQQFPQQPNPGAIPQQQTQFGASQPNQGLQSSASVVSAADAISAMNFHLEKPVEEQETSKVVKKARGKYNEGQKVYYKSSSYSGEAEILKVHLDDELKPFYTIKVNGREKQTDESHLGADPFVQGGESSLLKQVTEVLASLSNEQLQNVLNFAKGLAAESPGGTSPVNTIPNQPPSVPSSIGGNSDNVTAGETYGTNPVLQAGQQPVHQQPATQPSFSFPNQTQSSPNATDAFAGIPSPSSMNKQAVQLNSGSLPSNAFQQPASSGTPSSESIAPSHLSQMSFQPQVQNMPQMQMPSNSPFPNQAFIQQQIPQGHEGHNMYAHYQPQINDFQSPPAQMETPPSPKGNPFDFH